MSTIKLYYFIHIKLVECSKLEAIYLLNIYNNNSNLIKLMKKMILSMILSVNANFLLNKKQQED